MVCIGSSLCLAFAVVEVLHTLHAGHLVALAATWSLHKHASIAMMAQDQLHKLRLHPKTQPKSAVTVQSSYAVQAFYASSGHVMHGMLLQSDATAVNDVHPAGTLWFCTEHLLPFCIPHAL